MEEGEARKGIVEHCMLSNAIKDAIVDAHRKLIEYSG